MKTRLLKNGYKKDQIESQLIKVVDKTMIWKCAPADTDEDQKPFVKGTPEMKKS